MESPLAAPPVQYTKTSDGYTIAYMTSGSGPAIVYLPRFFQHAQRLWRGGPIAASLRRLSARFQVTQYDSRGQGMSQRGLSEAHSMEAYERDLDVAIAATGQTRPVLIAADHFGHVAIRYAVRNPDRVAALILFNTSVDSTYGSLSTNELAKIAESNWDTYLVITARTLFGEMNPSGIVAYFKAAADQDDLVKFLAVAGESNVADIALLLKTPVLIISASENRNWPGSEDFGKRLAPLIKGARLVVRTSEVGTDLEAVTAPEVDSFLEEIGFTAPEPETGRMPDGLSPREAEVLRLIAAGKSNPQIAEELVLSINTVQRHVSNILAKTGLSNRTEAATYATRHGLTN